MKRRSLGLKVAWLGSILMLALALEFGATAVDWPQYRGTNHDAISPDRITFDWRGSVTNAVWKVPVTNGFCSLAVSGGRVFTQIRRRISSANKEVCVALSATNGAELWATPIETATYDGGTGIDDQDGPRTTPTVCGDAVFVLSSHLKLLKLNATNGSVIWSNNLITRFGGSIIAWQNAASPVVEKGLIYVNVNCASSNLVALRTTDGGVAWRSQNGEEMTHASPVVATILDRRQVLFPTQSGIVSLDPETGTFLWKFNYPFGYSTCLAVSPAVYEDMVFISGAYGMGSVVARVSRSGGIWSATQLWSSTSSSRQSHWMTPVCYQGHLYGQFGSALTSPLKCIAMETGEQKWSVSGFGRGGAVLVNNKLVALTESGALVLIEPNTNRYTELARFQAVSASCWNSPAICDGRLYVRSTTQGALFNMALPELRLNQPQMLAENKLRLTISSADGSALGTNRLSNLEIRSTTNLASSPPTWTKLTNALVVTNGNLRVDINADPPGQFFMTAEPK